MKDTFYRRIVHTVVMVASAVLIGTDLPELSGEIICSAFAKLERYDVVLCAPHRDEVPRHGGTMPEDFHRGAGFTVAYGLAGLPVVVVRCGENMGLPVGVQIVCKPWREDLALAVAAYLEQQEFGGWRAPSI